MPRRRRLTPALAPVALALALVCVACGGSPGRVSGALPSPSFVHESDAIWVTTARGLTRVRLDGGGRRDVFAARYHTLAISPDATTLALGDADTNLYLGDAAGGRVRRVPGLDRRTGPVAFSPDGRTLAVARHADFSLPQGAWGQTEDDALYLVDVATGDVQAVPASSRGLVVALGWSLDGARVHVEMQEGDARSVEISTRARRQPDPFPAADALAARGTGVPATCRSTGAELQLAGFRGDSGLDVLTPGQGLRHLVRIEGRERGFHDYLATVADTFFSPSCRTVVYRFGQHVWVVDVASTRTAPLVRGHDAFPAWPRAR